MSETAKPERVNLSIAIPTLDRGEVLLRTIDLLSGLSPRPLEILILDQTPEHPPSVLERLEGLDAEGTIRWIRLEHPSIPGAMNRALLEARGALVLFLDDDIVPGEDLIRAHLEAHAGGRDLAVAGQILQPREVPEPLSPGEPFRFNSTTPRRIETLMGGNLSVPRERALEVGGFDEAFVQAAYRFEADFARRWLAAGGRITFPPRASLRHLRAARGGTRAYGDHLTTHRPGHAVGEYYYLLRAFGWRALRRILGRLVRSVATRFHLRRPWRTPITLWAEVSGLAWALALAMKPPRLLSRFPQRREPDIP